MTIDQTASRTDEQGEAAGELSLVLRAEDGTAYAIPQAVVEGYRLSDEQWTELEAQIKAEGSDVEGFYYGPSGNVGSFAPTMRRLVPQDWGIGTVYVPRMVPWQPIDYHPPVR